MTVFLSVLKQIKYYSCKSYVKIDINYYFNDSWSDKHCIKGWKILFIEFYIWVVVIIKYWIWCWIKQEDYKGNQFLNNDLLFIFLKSLRIFWLQTILDQLQFWGEIIKRVPNQIRADNKENLLKGPFDTNIVDNSKKRNWKMNEQSKQAREINFKTQFYKNVNLGQS